MSGDIYNALGPLYAVSKLLGLAPYSLGKAGSTIPDITKTSRFRFSTLHNFMMIIFVFGWFLFDTTWEAIHTYPKLSVKGLIPVVLRTCTFTSACLSTLILCHRGTLSELCSKLSLIDNVLLGRKALSSYMKTRIIIIVAIVLVFLFSCITRIAEVEGREFGLISVIKLSGYTVGVIIIMFMLLHFLVFVWILKNRFVKVNAQLSALVAHEFEEEQLMSLLSALSPVNEMILIGEFNVVNGSKALGRKDHVPFSLTNARSQVFQYNSNQIRVLRLTHGILCDMVQRVNSDYGFQILSELSYAFVSFVMFSFVAIDGESDPTWGDCEYGPLSCFRVLTYLLISCLCLAKVLSVASSCHAVTSEISATSRIVRKLLSARHISAEKLAELQLFSQQLWNADPRFTAFGFFELNLNLLCSVLGAATTYIVVLLQLK
jgi:hypothetical protein